jgi:PAS domain S-box-containing protein
MSLEGDAIAELAAQALLATTADAIVGTDRDGVIRLWNPGAVRIFGFAAQDALGRSLDIIIPENLRARHWSGWARVIATGESRYGAGDLLAVPAMAAGGRRISIEFTITALRDSGGAIVGMLAIIRDVTARFEEVRDLKRRLAALEH